MRLRWARSATKHRVSRRRSRHVIEHCGFRYRSGSRRPEEDDRFLYLGDDERGVPLEVLAIELDEGDLYVIHAMPLRDRYRRLYEEAKRWRV